MRLEQGWKRSDSHQRIVVEIALLDPAILHRDLQSERGAKPVNRASLQLCLHCIRVDRIATVNGCDNAFNG